MFYPFSCDPEFMQSGVSLCDVLCCLAYFYSRVAGFLLFIGPMGGMVRMVYCRLVPAAQQLSDEESLSFLAHLTSAGELVWLTGGEAHEGCARWTEYDFDAGTQTTFSICKDDPKTRHDIVVTPLKPMGQKEKLT